MQIVRRLVREDAERAGLERILLQIGSDELEVLLKYPKSEAPLERWYKVVSKTDFKTFGELRKAFPSVDKVGDLFVFNIGGNNYRLIAAIHFSRGKVFIQHVLTHREYDEEGWKQ